MVRNYCIKSKFDNSVNMYLVISLHPLVWGL